MGANIPGLIMFALALAGLGFGCWFISRWFANRRKTQINAGHYDREYQVPAAPAPQPALAAAAPATAGVVSCPSCSGPVKPGAQFCKACGAALPAQPETAPPPTGLTCPQCNATVKSGAKFCKACGAPQS